MSSYPLAPKAPVGRGVVSIDRQEACSQPATPLRGILYGVVFSGFLWSLLIFVLMLVM